MCWKNAALIAWLMTAVAASARGQLENVSETLIIHAASADSWSENDTSILNLTGPVTVEMDGVKLSGDNAVVWLSPAPGGLLEEQQAQIVLIGNANLAATDNHITRSGDNLLVTRIVRGDIQLVAPERMARDDSQEPVFLQADGIRSGGGGAEESASTQPIPATPEEPQPGQTAAVGVALAPANVKPNPAQGVVEFHGSLETRWLTDGTEAVIITNGSVTQARDNGNFLELQAARIVVFTSITMQQSESRDFTDIGKKVVGVYLEEDVRINFAPADPHKAEQRLTADRAYYDLRTDRAVMTEVVLHTVDPMSQIPMIFRAEKVRQLAEGEYTAEHAQMTSSTFASPTYEIRTSYAYIHEVPDPYQGSDYEFESTDDSGRVFGLPVMYFPALSGTLTNSFPIREFNVGSNSKYGYYAMTDWGLFESLGRPAPKDLDVDYRLDYLNNRGPGGGIDAKYNGGFIDETSREPWDFTGDLTSYIMDDRGQDNLGGSRAFVTPPEEIRGRFLWEHEHFFPDDWQVQVRGGYVTDPTFVEEYYQNEYDSQLPYDAEFYVKRQRDTESISFLGSFDTTHFVTNSAAQPNQFDVERLPELDYRRIGDSFADDNLTFFSDNSAARLRFANSRDPLIDYGYYNGLSPGLPSAGLTGTPSFPVYREDSRQEVDWPISLGQFKIVPYTIGRATEYSNSPNGDAQTRLMGGGGVRMSTTFWTVYDSVDSELFDVHRVRSILQPEINLFSTGTTVAEDDLYDYDPNVDAATDVSAGQLALHQRWETMRGGPGHWRSVDVLDVNVDGNFFANQPPSNFLNPTGFRSLFFPAAPETSVARNGINADAAWHLSDTMVLLGESEWNAQTHEQADAGIGLAIARDDRLTLLFSDSYLQPVESQIVSFAAAYKLTSKYTLGVGQSFYFGESKDVSSSISFLRQFDAFSMGVAIYHDAIDNSNGFNINLIPQGAKGYNGVLNGF